MPRWVGADFQPTLAHEMEHRRTGKRLLEDPTGWLASEKLDGFRAIWNGESLQSRNGNPIVAPDWFIAPLPKDHVLDGELHAGRGNFQRVSSIARKKKPVEDEWRELTFSVFDVATPAGGIAELPYRERLEVLKGIFRRRHMTAGTAQTFLRTCWQTCVESAEALKTFADDIVAGGGEGAIVRDPEAPYEHKRTKRLLKVKPTYDAEAIIVGHEPGEGKYEGMLGAFRCELESDRSVRFKMSGMTDEIRSSYESTHPVGTRVTFLYAGLTDAGVPRHPQYLRIREE